MGRKTSSTDLTKNAEYVNSTRVSDDLFADKQEVADALEATKKSFGRGTGTAK